LLARSLERVWEERLRADQIEQEYNVWRRSRRSRYPVAVDRRYRRLERTSHAFGAPQRRRQCIASQTDHSAASQRGRAGSEASASADQDRLRQRIIELNGQQRVSCEIACILNAVLRVGLPFSGDMVHQLQKR
jgi:hypothetical protein